MLALLPTGIFTITANAATSGTTGDCTWTLDGTVLTISGTGEMANYDGYVPWESVTEVIIENGVTRIGDYAFSFCDRLTNITIPNSVTNIGEYAFYYCTSLTGITIPNGVTSIEEYVFFSCFCLLNLMCKFMKCNNHKKRNI